MAKLHPFLVQRAKPPAKMNHNNLALLADALEAGGNINESLDVQIEMYRRALSAVQLGTHLNAVSTTATNTPCQRSTNLPRS
jgi:hypothetical protein